MDKITLEEILAWTGGALLNDKIISNGDRFFGQISTDTRNLPEGCLFVALRGTRFDGHEFIEQAIAGGAGGLLIDNSGFPAEDMPAIPVILTGDTLSAYQAIAAGYRQKLAARVIAVTGSVGKTMTRRLISRCLDADLKVHQTAENLNNEIGLPQSILAAEPEHDVLVLELGMRGAGEISLLSKICRPDIAVITNIGWAHIGRLGSLENILQAKTEIVDGMSDTSLLIINADDQLLLDWSRNNKNIKRLALVMKNQRTGDLPEHEYALWAEDIAAGKEGTEYTACIRKTSKDTARVNVRLSLPGMHNVLNSLFGLAAAAALNIDLQAAAKGLVQDISTGSRQKLIHLSDYLIMDDSYNAGPESMESALRTLAGLAAGDHRLIAVLGGMLELGEYSFQAHRQIGKIASQLGYSGLFLMGEYACEVVFGVRETGNNPYIGCHDCHESLLRDLTANIRPGDYILIKGSRAYSLEQVAQRLQEHIVSGHGQGKGNDR